MSKARSQTPNPITGTWTKRDDKSGKFMDVKADPKPFEGVRMTNKMKLDPRPARKGWAPGDYTCKCVVTGDFFIGDKRATMCADAAYADWKPTHRHLKTGGLYMLIPGEITLEKTWESHVVYEAVNGRRIARAVLEFHDGRFEKLPEPERCDALWTQP